MNVNHQNNETPLLLLLLHCFSTSDRLSPTSFPDASSVVFYFVDHPSTQAEFTVVDVEVI